MNSDGSVIWHEWIINARLRYSAFLIGMDCEEWFELI